LTPDAQSSVFSMFRGRYERGELERLLKEERPWLSEVKRILEDRMASMRAMSRHRIKNLVGRTLNPLLTSEEPKSLGAPFAASVDSADC
jgi:hypothetical protein